MPAVKTGDGPWGEAIRYWLPRRNMRQADLARRTGIEEKTISSMSRGFHTTTRKLEAVAKAFGVPIDDVLVSPARYQANEDRKRIIQEAVEAALRMTESARPSAAAATDAAIEAMEKATQKLEAAEPHVGQRPTKIQKGRKSKSVGIKKR